MFNQTEKVINSAQIAILSSRYCFLCHLITLSFIKLTNYHVILNRFYRFLLLLMQEFAVIFNVSMFRFTSLDIRQVFSWLLCRNDYEIFIKNLKLTLELMQDYQIYSRRTKLSPWLLINQLFYAKFFHKNWLIVLDLFCIPRLVFLHLLALEQHKKHSCTIHNSNVQ